MTEAVDGGALEGVRVLEVGGEIGAWCGKLLADMGATVVKVEPPGGDRTRSYEPFYQDQPDPERSRALHKWTASSLSDAKVRALIASAKPKRPLPCPIAEFDRDPFLLNLVNGTLDLRTAELRPHQRSDLIRALAPIEFSPHARCPRWDRFLVRILAGREDLIQYLQRVVGYSLTGSIREQVFFLLHGTGANGKSVLLATLRGLLGDYARQSDFNAFLLQRNDGPRNDLARLVGSRLVVASEAERGRSLSESIVKQLTGGDAIAARFLYQEHFEYTPEFKLFLAANAKPVIRGTDPAIWRRVQLIPFDVAIPEEDQDKELPAKLHEELPGILNWALRGCLAWQKQGLGEPEEVRTATGAYRAEMDLLAHFVAERCVEGEDAKVKASELHRAYTEWCQTSGEKPPSQRDLSTLLIEKGLERRRLEAGVHYFGLKLRPEHEPYSQNEP